MQYQRRTGRERICAERKKAARVGRQGIGLRSHTTPYACCKVDRVFLKFARAVTQARYRKRGCWYDVKMSETIALKPCFYTIMSISETRSRTIQGIPLAARQQTSYGISVMRGINNPRAKHAYAIRYRSETYPSIGTNATRFSRWAERGYTGRRHECSSLQKNQHVKRATF